MPPDISADPRPVVILGGGGQVGRRAARLLAAYFPIRIVDLDEARASAAAAEVRATSPDAIVETAPAPRDNSSLGSALDGGRLLVLAAEAARAPAAAVARAALRAGLSFIDLQPSRPAKLKALHPLGAQAGERGLTFVTDGGARAGLFGVLVRHLAAQLHSVDRVDGALAVASGSDLSQLSPTMVRDYLTEARRGNPTMLVEGQWRKLQARYFPVYMLPAPYGRRVGYPVFLGEMRGLRDALPTMTQMGFYLCGFGSAVDYGAAPFSAALDALKLTALSDSLTAAALRRTDRGGAGMMMRVEATGVKDGWPTRLCLEVTHPDPSFLPAAALSACVRQMLDEDTARPGIWQQGLYGSPARFLADLEAMGVAVTLRDTSETVPDIE